jgi:hypothetical protein
VPESEAAFSEDLSQFEGSQLFDPREEMCNAYYSMLCRFGQPHLILDNGGKGRF